MLLAQCSAAEESTDGHLQATRLQAGLLQAGLLQTGPLQTGSRDRLFAPVEGRSSRELARVAADGLAESPGLEPYQATQLGKATKRRSRQK